MKTLVTLADAARLSGLALVLALAACDGTMDPGSLPEKPELLDPASGSQSTTDSPTFRVRNARGFDLGASYTFRVAVASNDREVVRQTVPAGSGTTTLRFAAPLVRGATLAWTVTATAASGGSTAVSERGTFRLPPNVCPTPAPGNPYAKQVTDSWMPACSRSQNRLIAPQAVLGEPDAGGNADDNYFGFMSLGDGGYVAVDMGSCVRDGAGDDVRVYQSVSMEEVTLYASSNPQGPWVLVEFRKTCGTRLSGVFSRTCTFDLGQAGLEDARYLKIEDGELWPCPGGTVSEGADIDAVEVLNPR